MPKNTIAQQISSLVVEQINLQALVSEGSRQGNIVVRNKTEAMRKATAEDGHWALGPFHPY